jgi:hypothetical protein
MLGYLVICGTSGHPAVRPAHQMSLIDTVARMAQSVVSSLHLPEILLMSFGTQIMKIKTFIFSTEVLILPGAIHAKDQAY